MTQLIRRFAGAFQLLFVVAIVGGAIMFAFVLDSDNRVSYPAAAQPSLSVSVITPDETVYRHVVNLNGVVAARTTTDIIPQVSGRVTKVSPQFRPGARIAKGSLLFSIEPADYELAVQRTLAEIQAARSELALLEAQATVEKEIWKTQVTDREIPDLIARVPQIAAANARISSAEAARDAAELALSRTVIRSPFDARVLETRLDVGQVVSTAAMVGSIFSVDSLEIAAPISLQELVLIGDAVGQSASIAMESSGDSDLSGEIVRQAAALNEQTRLGTLYIATSESESLTLGEFVSVEILGTNTPRTYRLPSSTLTSRDQVWVVSNGVLESRRVEVLGNEADVAIVSVFDIAEGIVAIPPAGVSAGLAVTFESKQGLAYTGSGTDGGE